MSVTFFGVPKVSINDVVDGTIALIGSKIATESMHKPYGVGSAARVLRKVSCEYTGYIPALNIDIHEKDVVDLGDYDESSIGSAVRGVLKRGGIAIVIGGDHATTYYALKDSGVKSILWLDAHLDISEEEKVSHASALRHLIRNSNGRIRTIVIGFRGYSTPRMEINYAKKLGLEIIPYPFPQEYLKKALEKADAISLDMDFFDAVFFKATRVPEILGMSLSEFIIRLRSVSKLNAVYFDFVEYCPEIDLGYTHGKILAQLILEVISAFIKSGYG
ncbi:MAG: arginase family protein [Candidatus Njordarchaeales archaeon]